MLSCPNIPLLLRTFRKQPFVHSMIKRQVTLSAYCSLDDLNIAASGQTKAAGLSTGGPFALKRKPYV